MDLREFLKRNESVDILRFITCGSVDDGKSTLIGRLLYDAKGIFEDQLNGARNERGEIDFANLVDGLASANKASLSTWRIDFLAPIRKNISSPILPATSNTPEIWRLPRVRRTSQSS